MENRVDQNPLFQSALAYLQKFGFSIIPVKPDKRPYIKWEPFQKRRATLEEIKGWWAKYPDAMIGIVTGSISGIVIIDIDNAEGKGAIEDYIPDTLLIPTVQTPGGGQHLYFKSPEKPPSNNAGLIPGCDFRGEGGYIVAPPSINGIGQAYRWLEGLSIEDVVPPDLPDTYINYLLNNSIYYKCGDRNFVTDFVTFFEEGRRDEDLFHIANCLVKGGAEEKIVLKVLEILALNCKPAFPLEEISEKIKSALKREKRREINLAEGVREWVSVTNGYFSVTDCDTALQSVTGVTKRDNIRQILYRLWKEGIIERYGDRDGVYRRVKTECSEIDFLNASIDPIPLTLPLEIEKFVRILPKNIIIIAGTPDAGKTAYLLNVVKLNMDRFKIHYFSSEMGSVEMKDRLSHFDMPLEEWRKCSFKERSSNFSDVIVPGDINIIDFIEIHDEFYRVGGLLKDIYDKLSTGIAIIALQKKPGQDVGRGGLGTLEKPRLYLAIDSGKLKIVKGKNWMNPQVNPNGLEISFKLVNGCKFLKVGDWGKTSPVPNLYNETPSQFKFARKRLGKKDLCKEFKEQSGGY